MKNPGKKAGFWADLPGPFYALAPMLDVTDAAFRRVIARKGKPHILFTEFVSCDGLSSRGLPNLMKHLWYDEIERPIVAQVFGENPETHYKTATLCKELGFDGIDINMGCPVKHVTKTGGGSAMIKTPELAKDIIAATIAGADPLPVSVKTRIGYNDIVIEEWVGHLLETKPVAITLHMRTRNEMSDVDAHWDEMPKAVAMAKDTDILIVGNGDIRSLSHADQLVKDTGMDGAMMGRAIFGNPWLFNREHEGQLITLEERFDFMLEHAYEYENIYGGVKRFANMRKHLLAHASGFFGCKDLRIRLEHIESAADVYDALQWYRQRYGTSNDLINDHQLETEKKV